MRYAALPLILSVLLTASPLAAGAEPEVRVLSTNASGISLLFEMKDFEIEWVSIEGEDFLLASIPGGGYEGGAGDPAVPVYSRLVTIPAGAAVRVTSTPIETEVRERVRLVPVAATEQPGEPRGKTDRSPVAVETDEVMIGRQEMLRDLPVANITFRPVRYDEAAETITLTKQMRVDIRFEGGAPDGPGKSGLLRVPASFDDLYRNLVVNYEESIPEREIVPGGILMFCADSVSVIDSLQLLIEWKKRKGTPVTLVTLSETGLGTRHDVLDYIQGVYDDPASNLEYVILAGDAGAVEYKVPTWRETMSGWFGEGDLPYQLLSGDDILPDIHIGRLSFNTMDELSVIIHKTIRYESEPWIADDPGWFTRACIVGDPTDSGYSTIETGKWVRDRLIVLGYDDVNTIFSGPWVSKMLTNLNLGNSLFGYRGFGGMSGWSIGYTNILTNREKMPYCVIMTCGVGSFADGTARSEAFLKYGSINPFVPKGGIGAVATATNGTHTRYNNCAYFGLWRGLLWEGQHTMGSSLSRSSVELYLNYYLAEPEAAQIWSHWNNLMGDPTVDIYTAYPESLGVTYAAAVPRGANSVSIEVTDGGAPCEGALVCLWKGEESYSTGHSDEQGLIELPVSPATAGEMLLTVTKHNRHPHLASIAVIDTFHVGAVATMIDDDGDGGSAGNSDGAINPGETIEIRVALENFGDQTVAALAATLTTTDPFVTILDGSEDFGDLPASATAWCVEDFDILVDGGCPDGHIIQVGVDAAAAAGSWRSLLEFAVVSAELSVDSIALHSAGPNGILDPGETAELSVVLRNGGSADAVLTTATLVPVGAKAAVNDGFGDFGTITVGSAAENEADRFVISADPSAYEGYLASFLLVADFSGGASDTVPVSLTIGERTENDPVGPDSYGYMAYDNLDSGYAEMPVYDWIEIDNTLGGQGAVVPMGDNGEYMDVTTVMDLPFTFRYYGEDFDRVSISSNGWLAMGETELLAYRNWTIPGAGGPSGMIAPFWDNLYQAINTGWVFEWHDTANHRWVVEWSRFLNLYCHAEETFQVILYDPAWHSTETGDGLIEFQYGPLYNCDALNGRATVGIESPDQGDGVLITYYGEYSAGAGVVMNGRAIRFIPVGSDDIATTVESGTPATPLADGLQGNRPNPFNPATTLSYTVAEAGPVSLKVYDVSGRRVRNLVDGPAEPGRYDAAWDGKDDSGRSVASGVYMVRFETARRAEVQRITLVR